VLALGLCLSGAPPGTGAAGQEPTATTAVTTTPVASGASVASTRSTRTTTNAADAARTGWYPEEPGLAPAAVGSEDFGPRWRTRVEGQIYAQPLAWAGTVIVVTAANMAYGLDQLTGAIRWSRSLDPPVLAANLRCSDLTPLIGVTSTPVIDPATSTAYVLTKTAIDGRYAHRLHALDVVTGAARDRFPVTIAGSAANDPSQVFDSTWQHQRPGLALLDGVIYAGFGAHCDLGRYRGWMVGVRTDGTVATLWSAYAGVADNGAGIWQSGSAPVSDGSGRLFVTTGNGFGARSGQLGADPPRQLAQSVVRLDVQPDASLRAGDFFSPYDAPRLDAIDGDLGASSPVALPAGFGGSTRPLLLQSSKTGYLYLLDRDDLGGRGTGRNGGDRVLSRVGPEGGQWGKSAVWPGDGGWLYTVTNTRDQLLLAHQVIADAGGRPRLVRRASSGEAFGKLSGTPVVTSDGTAAGSGVVWAVHRDATAGRSELRAYAAVPVDGRLGLLWRGGIGDAVKFSSPLPVDGQVIMGALDGTVTAFGRPRLVSDASPPVPATPVAGAVALLPDVFSLGGVPVGATGTGTLALRNATSEAIEVRSVRADPAGEVVPGWIRPGTVVAPGAALAVPFTIRPPRPGEIAVTIIVGTSAGDARALITAVAGRAGRLEVAPLRIDLGRVVVGRPVPVRFQAANRGGSPLSISRSKSPAGATGWVTLVDLPEGTTLAPGEATTVEGVFTAGRPGPVRLTWTLNADVAAAATTVTITATASRAP
jgi:outer membrane protein assembly factor BamB